MSTKKLIEADAIKVTHGCSVIMSSKVAEKMEESKTFTIPFTIGKHDFRKDLCYLGASINRMPFSIIKKIGFDAPIPISMRLLMDDQLIKRPIRILFDALVKVGKFIHLMDFVVRDCEMDQEVPIILGQPFLDTRRTVFDLEMGEIKFKVHEDEDYHNVCKTRKQPVKLQVIYLVDAEIEKLNEGGL
ncbi:uncharacterized protein LOC107846368 [Capsicum annuum]|uniref:uncharacterized protein LOC107846368 n=1 Tax=Capsicum annuum TaxID=4072 RepID=UPI0007BEBDE8|nr:uncharacterized protein LOC107846368 [Capsicum annuum]